MNTLAALDRERDQDLFETVTEEEIIYLWRSIKGRGLSEDEAWQAVVTGIALDMVTVIIASVALGIGIDAAIQYAVRFRRELAATNGDLAEAIRRSHATIGRAILIATSIVFAGFAMLCFSQFVPTIYFGLFTGLAILMGLFASLTTLPASFLLLKYPRRK